MIVPCTCPLRHTCQSIAKGRRLSLLGATAADARAVFRTGVTPFAASISRNFVTWMCCKCCR